MCECALNGPERFSRSGVQHGIILICLKVSLGDFDDQLGLGSLDLQEDLMNLTEWVSVLKFRKMRRDKMKTKV